MAFKRGAGGAGSSKTRQGTQQAAQRRDQQRDRPRHPDQQRKQGSNKKGKG